MPYGSKTPYQKRGRNADKWNRRVKAKRAKLLLQQRRYKTSYAKMMKQMT